MEAGALGAGAVGREKESASQRLGCICTTGFGTGFGVVGFGVKDLGVGSYGAGVVVAFFWLIFVQTTRISIPAIINKTSQYTKLSKHRQLFLYYYQILYVGKLAFRA